MTDEEQDREECRRMYADWEQACVDEDDAISRKSLIEEHLGAYDVDPENPPNWITT